MFSSMIAAAIIIHGCLLSENLGWEFICAILLILSVLIVLSIILALIAVYKKDKNSKE